MNQDALLTNIIQYACKNSQFYSCASDAIHEIPSNPFEHLKKCG